ncbi:MAG: mechanosensitive ion channel [Victivallaceae bacterium]|nr:mechanosensitive ion channel [Victivallaceae bacterium]
MALYGLKVIAALLIVLIGRIVAKIVRALLKKTLRKLHIDETLISFISNICYFGIFAFAVIAALGKMGVETASFVVVLGSAGLAIGLALQGSLANFAAGILMIIFKPFKVGDYIEGGGAAGSVEDIGIFTTDLNSPDNKKIIIPNAKLTTDKIVNYSAKEIRRVDIVAGVSYHDDLDKVKRVLEDILAKDERVLAEPASVVAVLELGDSSINLVVRPWVKTADYWPVLFSVKENIKKRFDAEGITIPFPQQDVHIHKAD